MMTLKAQPNELVLICESSTVRCNETLFASAACQVRSQDAYYVLQGLGVETRETTWLWLKVKSLLVDTRTKPSSFSSNI
jgi:hypothetical protein